MEPPPDAQRADERVAREGVRGARHLARKYSVLYDHKERLQTHAQQGPEGLPGAEQRPSEVKHIESFHRSKTHWHRASRL